MSGINKIVSEEAFEEVVKQVYEAIKLRALSRHNHNASEINVDPTHKFVTDLQISDWNKRVTQEQLTTAVNTFASGLAWKGVYTTLASLREKVPNPKEGYFVIVTQEPTYNHKNTLLIYEAENINKWQTVGELFIPGKATQEQDGLMSKEDKKKLDGLENYTLPVANKTTLGGVKAKEGGAITIGADGVIDINGEKVVTTAEKQKWNKASTDATQALQKADTNAQSITTANNKIAEVEKKFVYMTVEEAQAIINKHKA